MNDERDIRAADELVSHTYREHSTERTPERLNRKILDLAADRSGRIEKLRGLFVSWTRPLALAATIVLSFAIVIEVTRLPEPVATPSVPASSAAESLSEEFRQRDSAIVDRAQDQARLRDGSNRSDNLVAEPQSILKLEKQQNQAVADAPAAAPNAATIAEAESVPENDDASGHLAPNRAERVRSSDLNDADARKAAAFGQTAAHSSKAYEKKESAAPSGCDASERESAASWLACIEALKQSGAIVQAETEYAEYILKFPAE